MPVCFLYLVRKFEAEAGMASIDRLLKTGGEEAEEILADCLLRTFIQRSDTEGYVSLTPLGVRLTSD